MIAEQTTYQDPWVNKIPADWNMLRIKNVFDEVDERSIDGLEELLSVSHYTGVTKKRDALENEDDHITNAKTLVGYKKVAENDLVSNIMLAWNGSLGISKYDGITSPAYCVYRIKGNNNPDYFGFLFSTAVMKGEFRRKSFGIIDSRLRLYSDKFFSIPVPVPTRAEQDVIVNYIKTKSKKIAHFVKKKEQFIDLLKEQRQEVINKAVTKGINSNVKLKDSGVEWLGEIPEHWEVIKIKFLLEGIIDAEHKTVHFVESSKFLVVRTSNIKKGVLTYNDAKYTDYEGYLKWTRRGVPEPGDILFTREAPAGEACIVPKNQKLCLGQRVVWLKVNQEKLDSEFAVNSIYSVVAFTFIDHLSMGSTVTHLNMSEIGNIPIVLPKSIDEQKMVVDYIKSETTIIDKAITQAQTEIELIKEYKEAMIAEAVLGKLNIAQHTKLEMENAN